MAYATSFVTFDGSFIIHSAYNDHHAKNFWHNFNILISGVVFVDGVFGVEQRKFCMKQLRRFGLGKTEMQERIAVEAKDFISCLQQKSKVVQHAILSSKS